MVPMSSWGEKWITVWAVTQHNGEWYKSRKRRVRTPKDFKVIGWDTTAMRDAWDECEKELEDYLKVMTEMGVL